MRRGLTVVGFGAAAALLIAGSVARLITFTLAGILLIVAMSAWRFFTGERPAWADPLSRLFRPTTIAGGDIGVVDEHPGAAAVKAAPARPSAVKVVREQGEGGGDEPDREDPEDEELAKTRAPIPEPQPTPEPPPVSFRMPEPRPTRRQPKKAPAPSAAPPAPREELLAAITDREPIPIDGYDSMTVAQILPALRGLTVEELELVELHERRGRSRATVLRRIDELCTLG